MKLVPSCATRARLSLANLPYPSTLRDVLVRVAIAGLLQAKWTDQILDEMFGNLKANRPDR